MAAAPRPYIGRFAPSPTGALHAGSITTALAVFLDAMSANGSWFVRVEDVDSIRCKADTAQIILQQLASCGLTSHMPTIWQSEPAQKRAYQAAFTRLKEMGLLYFCQCSRKTIWSEALKENPDRRNKNGDVIYSGTCRGKSLTVCSKTMNNGAWRLDVARAFDYLGMSSSNITWHDRRLGDQMQNVEQEVGDFVILRANGDFSYQLAVVVDDARQGVTDIVRGADLISNTARQILLQKLLGFSKPRYLHIPLVLGVNGQKLSKQNGAKEIDTASKEACATALEKALMALGLKNTKQEIQPGTATWFMQASIAWQQLNYK